MVETVIMLAAMFAVMYLFIIRPENQRKKKAQELRDSLKKGDTITSYGGIVGKIVHVNPETVIIETSEDRVRLELTKWAVSSRGVQSTDQPEYASEKKDDKKEEKDKKVKLNGASVADEEKK